MFVEMFERETMGPETPKRKTMTRLETLKAEDHDPDTTLIDQSGKQWTCVVVKRWRSKRSGVEKASQRGKIIDPQDLPKLEDLNKMKEQVDKLQKDISILQASLGVV